MNLLYISEITGKAGIALVKKLMPRLREKYCPDIIIGNANSATGCGGLGIQHAGYLRKLGIECITGGDSIFNRKDLTEALDRLPYVLRPVNLPDCSPGKGWRFINLQNPAKKIAVVSAIGQIGQHRIFADNPFVKLEHLITFLSKETDTVIIDFSASATAEKQTLIHLLAGKVSAIIGSGTKVPTSDESIFAGRTAYITDSGRTGSFNSVGGYEPSYKIQEYLKGLPDFGRDCWTRPVLQGVNIRFDDSGAAAGIERIFEEGILCGNKVS